MQVFQRKRRLLKQPKYASKLIWKHWASWSKPVPSCSSPSLCKLPAVSASCLLQVIKMRETCLISVQCNFRDVKKRSWEAFLLKLKVLCLDQAGSIQIWAGDAYWKEKNTMVQKKIVKFFCVSSGTSWILLPLGKWSGLMYKEYKNLNDKSVSLK